MPTLNRIVNNVLTNNLTASANFYRRLVGMETIFESDWYIMLCPPGQQNVQFALIDEASEFTPRLAAGVAAGTFVTLEVADVHEILARARQLGAEVLEAPTPQGYGQLRALIRDPNGLLLDLSTPIEPA